jgi:hypothetical protein
VKIIRLPKWWRRPYVQPDGTTTLLLILSGSLIQNMLEPSGETVWMHLQEGEDALWGPDIGHDSFATEDTQVVVIRWRKDSDPDTSRKA